MSTAVEQTIRSVTSAVGKSSNKPHLKVQFGDGSNTLCFDMAMQATLEEAMRNNTPLMVTIYHSRKGYSSIDQLDPVRRAGDPPPTHIIDRGAGNGAPSPAGTGGPVPPSVPRAPQNAAPQNLGPASGGPAIALDAHVDVYMVRALIVLSAAMIGWGGRFIRTPDDMFKWIVALGTFVKTGNTPAFGQAATQTLEQQGGGSPAPVSERLGGFDEDL